ncbi:hypothetical protein GCM10012287_20420 [Streptomyces daqingensis]|uniref:Uncharacterized protein n=1 Tax=Streptomyces daqingensis TaxID=1472640 RepID=A0ABQ2M705_9ACTN|nr:hypothetical protein GCM10012287_20420 [Streptomyces daqingensis]
MVDVGERTDGTFPEDDAFPENGALASRRAGRGLQLASVARPDRAIQSRSGVPDADSVNPRAPAWAAHTH